MEGGGIKLLVLDPMQYVEGDLELEKITEQNTRKNRHIPLLNSDLEAESTTKLFSRKLRRVRFSESCMVIPCGLDRAVSNYAFRKARGGDAPLYSPAKSRTIERQDDQCPIEMTSSSMLSLSLHEVNLFGQSLEPGERVADGAGSAADTTDARDTSDVRDKTEDCEEEEEDESSEWDF